MESLSELARNTQPGREQLKDVWQFDPETYQWKTKNPLPYHLSGFDICAYKDRYLVVVGGYSSSDDFTFEMKQLWNQDRFHASYYCPFVLVYDTVTDQWHRMPSLLPMPTNDIRAVLLDNKIYAVGAKILNRPPATQHLGYASAKFGCVRSDPGWIRGSGERSCTLEPSTSRSARNELATEREPVVI